MLVFPRFWEQMGNICGSEIPEWRCLVKNWEIVGILGRRKCLLYVVFFAKIASICSIIRLKIHLNLVFGGCSTQYLVWFREVFCRRP